MDIWLSFVIVAVATARRQVASNSVVQPEPEAVWRSVALFRWSNNGGCCFLCEDVSSSTDSRNFGGRGANAVSRARLFSSMKEMVGGCCVCSDERGWDENPLVYCDGNGCNVAVHQGRSSSLPSPAAHAHRPLTTAQTTTQFMFCFYLCRLWPCATRSMCTNFVICVVWNAFAE